MIKEEKNRERYRYRRKTKIIHNDYNKEFWKICYKSIVSPAG